MDGRKCLGMLLCAWATGLFLSVYVDIKMAGKRINLDPMLIRLMKHPGLEKPTQWLDQVNFGCTQRECKPNNSLVDMYREMFESLTSAGAVEKLLGSKEVNAHIAVQSYDMEGHAKKCVERHCELANTRHRAFA